MKKYFITIVLTILFFYTNAQPAPATVDPTFNAQLPTPINTSSGYPTLYINALVIQPDGKIILGGSLTSVDGTQDNIIRVNSDGSPDSTFNKGGDGFNNKYLRAVSCIALQPDGKIIIGGSLGVYDEKFDATGIARLNNDGTWDTSFVSVGNANCIALQPDGKIITGGSSNNNILRHNTDGTLDGTFKPGTGFAYSNGTPSVNAVALQTDGKIIAAGDFTSFNGVNCKKVVRLNVDGSLDTSFHVGAGSTGTMTCVYMQPDGKILVGGYFGTFNSLPYSEIVRLNADGSVDTSFHNLNGCNTTVYCMALQPDGRILVGGYLHALLTSGNVNYYTQKQLIRLNANGSIDTSFDVGNGFAANGINFSAGVFTVVHSLGIQPDGKILVGGNFAGPLNGILRLYGNPAISTGLLNQTSSKINVSVYPNPGNGMFQINSPEIINQLSVADLTGKIIITKAPNSEKAYIDLNNEAGGIYIVKVITGNGNQVFKIVKQ